MEHLLSRCGNIRLVAQRQGLSCCIDIKAIELAATDGGDEDPKLFMVHSIQRLMHRFSNIRCGSHRTPRRRRSAAAAAAAAITRQQQRDTEATLIPPTNSTTAAQSDIECKFVAVSYKL